MTAQGKVEVERVRADYIYSLCFVRRVVTGAVFGLQAKGGNQC